ncbi:MAG: hypothetical protein QM582_10115 [Micropruina sp.]|uniref:hypothetical protein n=1 Tax=Micropruina sp. TaxID=2737536 RepID=UPI0039E54AE1
MFTLRDDEDVLDPESFRTLGEAVARTRYPLWAGRPWTLYGPNGRPAYSHRYPKD